jgi:hypothetical protein
MLRILQAIFTLFQPPISTTIQFLLFQLLSWLAPALIFSFIYSLKPEQQFNGDVREPYHARWLLR